MPEESSTGHLHQAANGLGVHPVALRITVMPEVVTGSYMAKAERKCRFDSGSFVEAR